MNRPLACFALAAVAVAGLSLREQAKVGAFTSGSSDRSEPETTREQGQVREFTINGRDHRFSPTRIEVHKDDLVKITFTADDMAHGFTIDQYRIMKRAGSGQTVTFEFRADQSGSFDFYCNLTADERCRQMKGQLVVK
jgi:heme/copper-type cytochrome/quinol oxidase subunit 2